MIKGLLVTLAGGVTEIIKKKTHTHNNQSYAKLLPFEDATKLFILIHLYISIKLLVVVVKALK